MKPVYPATGNANFRSLTRRGLSTEYQFLACYVDYTVHEYALYRLALHEAGHAFGLSNVEDLYKYTYLSPDQARRISHPEIRNTVMNYDTNADEPDCSLHLFDVMAIHALYQTLKP